MPAQATRARCKLLYAGGATQGCTLSGEEEKGKEPKPEKQKAPANAEAL
jgi:hypothetical protein